MANSRGTEYSQGHIRLTVEDDEYWDFDWADMGKHDVPAMIDKVKEFSDKDKLFYIGYSQGAA